MPFGHVGDGNIHYNVTQPVGADKEQFLARWDEVNAVVFAVVKKFGGSISAEHGVGVMKRDILPSYKDPVALDLMRGVEADARSERDPQSRARCSKTTRPARRLSWRV